MVIPCSCRFQLCLVGLNVTDSAEVHYNVHKLLFQSLSYVYVFTVVQIKVSSFFSSFSTLLDSKTKKR